MSSGSLFSKIPLSFSAQIEISDRLGPEKYTGSIYKTQVDGKWSISARILTGNSTYLLYHDGKMVFDSIYEGKRMVRCVEPHDVPPFHHLEDVIKSAQPMERRDTYDQLVNMCRGELYHSVYAGESYVICQGPTGIIDSIVSESVNIKILRFGRDVPSRMPVLETLVKTSEIMKSQRLYLGLIDQILV